MLVFLAYVLYVYYFWLPKAGLVVSHAKFTCERRSFGETSLEFLLPWPACAVPSPADISPPFVANLCSCNTNGETTWKASKGSPQAELL